MPIKKDGEHILKCFGQNEASRYGYFYHFDPVNVSEYARQKLLTIYKISGDKGDISFTKISKRAIVDKLYDTRYSVNRLVSTASSNEIQNFILELIFKNKILTDIAHIINARSLSGLRRIIKDFPELEQRRAKEIQDELRPFNEEQKGLLKIEYSQNAPIKPPNISEWMFNEDNPRGYFSIKGRKYNISKADIVEYVFYVLSKEGIMDFLTMMFEDSMTEKRYAHPVLRFSEQFTQKHVEEGISEITNENQANIIDEIYRLLSRERNVAAILHYLKYVAQHKERFSLYFNVNSSTTSNGTANYKDVRKLSLGQKVVAMLDLIFAYGKYANDFRPIVIDQPEDNLDSQYIYKNLVSQLRTIKKNRQVIIATHNATIVTNAMADQVCVMNSDGSHGWVERSGYPSEKAIKNSILNYLEGGKDSFKHKQQIYRLVLNE